MILLLLLLFLFSWGLVSAAFVFVLCGDHESRKFMLRSNLHLSYDVKRNTSVMFYNGPHVLMVLQRLQESV